MEEKIEKVPTFSEKVLGILTKKKFKWHSIELIDDGFKLKCPYNEVSVKTNIGNTELSEIITRDVYVTNNGFVQLEDGFGISMFVDPASDSSKLGIILDSFLIMYLDLRIKDQREINERKK